MAPAMTADPPGAAEPEAGSTGRAGLVPAKQGGPPGQAPTAVAAAYLARLVEFVHAMEWGPAAKPAELGAYLAGVLLRKGARNLITGVPH